MFRIFLAVTALLIYGSLYPWQFHQARIAGNPLSVLLHSWPLVLDRYLVKDVALNVAIYLPFGTSAYLWLVRRSTVVRLALPVLMAASLSSAMEMIQLFDTQRMTSLLDVASNTAGAALGMVLGTLLHRGGRRAPVVALPHPDALLLFACWAGSMVFPLIPDLSRTHFREKLAAIFVEHFTPEMLFAGWVRWLIVARLAQALLGEYEGAWVFPVLGLVIPARFFILGLGVGWQQVLAFLMAWFAWAAFMAGAPRRDWILAALTLLSIAAVGLAPYHFAPYHFAPDAQRFEWVPFRALFSSEWETGMDIILSKAFLYGSAVWLLRTAGLGMVKAAAAVAAVLAVIEAAQLYLPRHAAESTDPLLAVAMAWLLHRLFCAGAGRMAGNISPQEGV